MPRPSASIAAIEKDPSARRIVARWRELTGGSRVRDDRRRTLVACSGGADSSALLIALSSLAAPGSIAAAHILHDMRSPDEARLDRDAAASLAERFGVRFIESPIAAKAFSGNYESAARRLRYQRLAELARAAACPFVATAHHADDQLETILMRLVRGSGPAGLGAIAPRRVIDRGEPSAVHLVRPMLVATREDSERICRSAQWLWREDSTNRDTSRLRSAIRQFVVPALKRTAPGCERRADDAARAGRQAAALVRIDAERLIASAMSSTLDRSRRASSTPDGPTVDRPARHVVSVTLDRSPMRAAQMIVAIEAIRLAAIRITGGDTLDAISARMLRSAAKTVRDDVGGVRRIEWKALSIEITRDHVTMSRSDETPP